MLELTFAAEEDRLLFDGSEMKSPAVAVKKGQGNYGRETFEFFLFIR